MTYSEVILWIINWRSSKANILFSNLFYLFYIQFSLSLIRTKTFNGNIELSTVDGSTLTELDAHSPLVAERERCGRRGVCWGFCFWSWSALKRFRIIYVWWINGCGWMCGWLVCLKMAFCANFKSVQKRT